jgi:hypothetical protein
VAEVDRHLDLVRVQAARTVAEGLERPLCLERRPGVAVIDRFLENFLDLSDV